MIQSVLKRNVLAAIFTIAVILFSVVPSSSAMWHRHYYVYHRHYYVYHHHSELKGALLGGAGGALIGGLAGHGKGALIGGAAGAGTGYLIQRYRNHHHHRHYVYYR
ncbi:MAG TPA: YMGG-like glycine zipper-containing protein [Blastocatellia bacterium]|nr:YMGG-like glycine zipper-containing protein [Blastocatellia bacterium]